MLDSHIIGDNPNWGLAPNLNFFGILVPSYSFFVLLGLVVGVLVYFYEARREKAMVGKNADNTIYILIAALVGGVLGAKLPYWIYYFPEIIKSYPNIMPILSGRTVLGGLIGGSLGVWYIKKKLNINVRRGNLFAPAIALGVAIGRVGCLFRGCCFGKSTSLPWGVNFGDGVLRHPTQIYESIFMLIMFFVLQYKKKHNPAPGSLFKFLMISYFTFRFFIEFFRTEQVVLFGLTVFQYICLAVLAWYGIKELKERRTRI
jgi:prolipoprotein diacylglyceryl transferase